jgi:hypothetical protein
MSDAFQMARRHEFSTRDLETGMAAPITHPDDALQGIRINL